MKAIAVQNRFFIDLSRSFQHLDGMGWGPPMSNGKVMIIPKPAPSCVVIQDTMEVIAIISEDRNGGGNYPRTANLGMPRPAIGCEGISV